VAKGAAWRGELKKLAIRIESLPEKAMDKAEEIVAAELREGAEEMRQIIRTADTPTGLAEGRSGRVKTGKMLGDVQDGRPQRFRRSVKGEYGWGVNGGNTEPYYQYQENGFQHYLSGKDVAPMHAFLTSFIHTRERFFKRMRDGLKDVLR
jgi:hypothetical protein